MPDEGLRLVRRSRRSTSTTIDTSRSADGQPLLEVDDLSIHFRTPAGEVQAVSDMSFAIHPGETLGMVGESGSGKSITGLSILRLLKSPPARVEGQIRFAGVDLLALSEREIESVRGRDISMIFQEPMTALDPVFTIGQQITETLRAHRDVTRRDAKRQAVEALESVGIPDPARRAAEYPHQLSGGMRQRAMIAMALVCRPRLLIADEPTTAVDVTIQAQILTLLRQLSHDHGTAVMLITHDLGVVAEACERVVTLYAGQVVEQGRVDEVLESPLHPYSSALLRSIPRVETRKAPLRSIPGRVPLPSEMPTGCRFRPRCEHAQDRCAEPQPLVPTADGRHARCCRYDELVLPGTVQ